MKIKDILQRDPAAPLVNQGQARIVDRMTEKEMAELKGELSSFVCEGQFAEGIEKIFSSFLANLGQTSQKAAWVSGFFGSGKSHLLKMLCHLWQDAQFDDGSTARSLVPSIPDELRASLRELDTAGRRSGGLIAAAGSLLSGSTDNVRLTVLGVLLRGIGLPEQYPQAQFCLWLQDQGYLEAVKASVAADGKDWAKELNNLYVSGPIARAILKCDRKFAQDEIEARKTLRAQFPTQTIDITTDQFVSTFKRALRLVGRDDRLPCTVLILDEVQQYIGDSSDRSGLMTEVAEALSKQMDSRVIVVGAGQSALTDVPLLQKLMDRFRIRVPLSDADVETVTRKVLLQKKPTTVSAVQKTLDNYAGEVSRQLQGTRIAERIEDREIIVDDYPLLPVRRRFWENCFRVLDAAGTHSQLRSQLQILQEVLSKLANKPITALIPGEELYEKLAPELVNTGVLLREINERIINLSKDGSREGELARRICGLVFLIGKLPREATVDIGVRATKEHIADLLVEDLSGENGKLRDSVGSMLQKLADKGVLMQVGDEYRLQTKEGSEWDREFRIRQAKLTGDEADVHVRRDTFLYAEADRIIRGLKIVQGASKEARYLSVSRDQNPPELDGETIRVWVRDEWSASQKESVDQARKQGPESPMIFVFIPRQSADDLRRYVIDAAAADQTLNAKGNPATPEGQEARRSMESRRDEAVRLRDTLVAEIVGNAKVFQGGGSELMQAKLEERLLAAASDSLARLFPRFKEADAPGTAWESVIKRARDGADQPFQPVGYTGPTEQHSVCQQVIATIGAGKIGSEVRKTLRSSPYGWPRDAVDAALIALHRSQHLTATLNGVPVALGQLDQNKIAKAEFRVEKATLTVTERLKIRGLYQELNIPCKAGEESSKAPDFLAALIALAKSAGGDPPLPVRPMTTDIEDMQKLVGNEQLVAIKNKEADLRKRINEWKKAKDLVGQRLPVWGLVERMGKHAAELPDAAEPLKQMNAIRDNRMLLAANDPATPVRAALATLLRKAIQESQATHESAFKAGMKSLAENATWPKVAEKDCKRILGEVGLVAPAKTDTSNDEAMLSALDSRSLAARQAEADAVTGRVQRALQLAARLLEPKVQIVTVEHATLRTERDAHEWAERQEKKIVEALKQGPVLVN
jgi:hypothetical protein